MPVDRSLLDPQKLEQHRDVFHKIFLDIRRLKLKKPELVNYCKTVSLPWDGSVQQITENIGGFHLGLLYDKYPAKRDDQVSVFQYSEIIRGNSQRQKVRMRTIKEQVDDYTSSDSEVEVEGARVHNPSPELEDSDGDEESSTPPKGMLRGSNFVGASNDEYLGGGLRRDVKPQSGAQEADYVELCKKVSKLSIHQLRHIHYEMLGKDPPDSMSIRQLRSCVVSLFS